MEYNYREAVENDVRRWVEDNKEDLAAYKDDELYDAIYQGCIDSDVTGSLSHSYWFNAYKAEEALCHNWELMYEACRTLGENDPLARGAEWCDVFIRVYLLSDAIIKVMSE